MGQSHEIFNLRVCSVHITWSPDLQKKKIVAQMLEIL